MLDPIIKIKDMSIIYNKGKENEFRASDNINADIYPGEYIIFFGPSGCGKSTVLYSVLGVLRPTAGHVIVKGEDIYNYDANQLVHYQTRTIGIMYQAFYLIPSLTIADNVTLPMIFEGIHPHIRRKRAMELLNRFGIGQHAHKLPEALSGGQMQRVSVARAFINDPEILLADEPVGNLDSISTEQVMSTLQNINDKDKKTILLVTHDAKHLPYAHRVIHIKDGRIARIVPNPEKEQIAKVDQQKNLITEMETLVKVHPYLSPSELKVKSIINYLTQDINFEQLQRLEGFCKLVIDGIIDSHKFLRLLTEDYKKGGVGLGAVEAKDMTDKITRIVAQSKDFRRYRRRMEENNFFNTDKELLKKLVRYVEAECPKKLSAPSQKNFNDIIYGRAAGLIKKEEFNDLLNKNELQGGVGLGRDMADNLTNYFEKIIMQGLSTEEGGH
jgi:putative ABC transport system ATP-binding protein